MKLAVVGAGAMGRHHARVIGESQATLAVVVDSDMSLAESVAGTYSAKAASSLEAVEACDGVVLATPTPLHMSMAKDLLHAGIPTLVEKPLVSPLGEAATLVEYSRQTDVPLACGFVERFNPAVRTSLDLLESPPLHFLAVRHSPREERMTNSVVHDVAIHDIDLALRFCEGPVFVASGVGWVPPGRKELEIVDASLRLGSGAIATISSNRWTQRKVRSIAVATESQLLEIDLLRQDVTVYHHLSHEIVGADYRANTVVDIPFVRHTGEPLSLQLQHFLKLINGDADPEKERRSILAPHLVGQDIEDAAKSHLASQGGL